MAAGVELDTSSLERGMRQLSAGLARAGSRVGMNQARDTAARIRDGVPVLSGRLRSTVSTVPVRDGGAVTYGGALPYADYIEGRTHAVEDGLDGADDGFASAMYRAAAQEVDRL